MSADVDTAKAVVNRWNASAAIAAAVPGGIQTDLLLGVQTDIPVKFDRLKEPYAKLEVEQGPRPNEYMSSGARIDYRKATISVWGVGKKAVGDAMSVIAGNFEDRASPWTIDNGSFMRLQNVGGEAIKVQPTTREGEHYHMGQLNYCFWTHRTQA